MDSDRQRIDKWLWHARFARTRTLCQKLVISGQIRLNRKKLSNTSHPIRIDDVLTINLERCVTVVKILKFATKRGPASEARELYEEISRISHERSSAKFQMGGEILSLKRPTKKERRQIEKFWNSITK